MRSQWSGRLTFILAASGSAIGLGNIWKFPYITGENGGGAFVLVYLLTILIVGLPIFVAEIYIGQQSQSNAITAFAKVLGRKTRFQSVGFMGILSAFLILSFYSVVGGWILSFLFRTISGDFAGLSTDEISGQLGKLLADPGSLIFWHSLFMVITALIVIGGIKSGIERGAKILMPVFFILLTGLLLFSASLEGFSPALRFLFEPDFSKLSPQAILEAVGHSFFTLSLGMGAMITYGSFLSKDEKVFRTALAITVLDTLVAIMAGLVMFSVTFTYGQEPSSGPALMFSTMPTLFLQLPGGSLLLSGFFTLVGFAAITSAISLLEVVVAYFSEEKNMSHKKATLVFAAIIWAVGVLCALSFNVFSGTVDFFDLFDKTTTHILMPLGGLLTAVFFGWKLPKAQVEDIFGSNKAIASTIIIASRWVAPTAVGIVMFFGLKDWFL